MTYRDIYYFIYLLYLPTYLPRFTKMPIIQHASEEDESLS